MNTYVFEFDNNCAIQVLAAFGLHPGDEVEILEQDEELIIRKPAANLLAAFDVLASLPEDFMANGREDEYFPREPKSLDEV